MYRFEEHELAVAMAKVVLNHGPLHRIWPSSDRGIVYASISAVRSSVKPTCQLVKSDDLGNSWRQLVDFYAMDSRNTTTGQPFSLNNGTILVPVWDAGFYEFGRQWLAIYRSQDGGDTWEQVYCNPSAVYGNHFFQGVRKREVFLCAGVGGGGFRGEVRYVPSRGLLLKSEDYGATWETCLEVEGPTAIYDGTTVGETVIVSARERSSIFRSEDGGRAWKEISLGGAARNVMKMDGRLVVSSDSSIVISENGGRNWSRRKIPIQKLVLRYPTVIKNRILLTGVGWRSLLLATDTELNDWWVCFDATRAAQTKFMTRMAVSGDHVFLGDEGQVGAMLRLDVRSLKLRHLFFYSLLGRLHAQDASKVFLEFEKSRHTSSNLDLSRQ